MRIFTSSWKSRKAAKLKSGLIAVTLVIAIGAAASAKDPAPEGKGPIPAKAKHHWFQVGTASWYGKRFQGHTTAGGEAFDMNALTCAHRTLPMGSWIRVTNLKNRKSIFVRVNDRGPVPDDRIVDLSFAAARAVGLRGIGKVRLEAVQTGDPELAKALMTQVQMPLIPGL